MMRWIGLALILGCLTTIEAVAGNYERKMRSKRTEFIKHFPGRSFKGTFKQRRNLVFVVLATGQFYAQDETNDDVILAKILPAMELGIRKIQQPGFLPADYDVTIISRDTFCSSIYGAIGFFEIFSVWDNNINAIFGLSCDYVLAPISRYCGIWDIPVLTVGGRAQSFDIKLDQYPTTTRLLGGHTAIGYAIKGMMAGFNWTKANLIFRNYEDGNRGFSSCALCLKAVYEILDEVPESYGFEGRLTNKENVTNILNSVKNGARSKISSFLGVCYFGVL